MYNSSISSHVTSPNSLQRRYKHAIDCNLVCKRVSLPADSMLSLRLINLHIETIQILSKCLLSQKSKAYKKFILN